MLYRECVALCVASLLGSIASTANAQQFETWKDDTPAKAPVKACAALRALTGYEFSIDTAVAMPAQGDTAAYCRVTGLVQPEVRFEVSLPAACRSRAAPGRGSQARLRHSHGLRPDRARQGCAGFRHGRVLRAQRREFPRDATRRGAADVARRHGRQRHGDGARGRNSRRAPVSRAHGTRQLVATSLLRTGMFCASMELSAVLALGKVMSPPSRTRPQNPLMNSYRASDGKWLWLIGAEASGIGADREGAGRRGALRRRALQDEPRSPPQRRGPGRHLRQHLRPPVPDEWAAILSQHDVVAPVNSFEDLVNDPQARAMGAFVEMPSMAGDGTTQTTLATPLDFGAEPVAPPPAPPQLGSDTQSVMRELGIDDDEIGRLREAKVIA